MPTYSYQCKRCSATKDVFHPMSAKPRVKCDDCGGPCARLLGTGAGIIFKGSGFYETDYKKKGGDNKPKSESTAAAKPESAAATKSESTASKPEPAPSSSASSKSAAKAD